MKRLNATIQKTLAELGFSDLTEVQSAALTPALEGKDLIVQAYTGTGKTLAFLLPALTQVSEDLHPQILVLEPTRELAVQVSNDAFKLCKALRIRGALIYGGAGMEPQIKQLRNGAQLVIGTPGRILDLIDRRVLNLSKVKTLILDEADVMLDMGFQRDVTNIISFTPKTRQTMLFCVDLPSEITHLAQKHMRNPVHINLLKEEKTKGSVTQWLYEIDPRKRMKFLIYLLRELKPTRSIIFCRTKFSTRKLAYQLQNEGFNCQELHGNLSQHRREEIMGAFKAGELDLLIATDVAARGIHVNKISHVFNYELPADVKYYLHRIGRTGRMDAIGDAISLVAPQDRQVLRDIERLIGKDIERKPTPDQFKFNAAADAPNQKPHGFRRFSFGSKRRMFG